MKLNWKLIGKWALGIAIVGVSGTTAVLIVKHVRKKNTEKKLSASGNLTDVDTNIEIEDLKSQIIAKSE
jgi:hypothetical protein